MKNNNSCPKCNSNEIVKINSDSIGPRIRTGTFTIAKLNYYVCCSCGYTEEWIDNKSDLKKISSNN